MGERGTGTGSREQGAGSREIAGVRRKAFHKTKARGIGKYTVSQAREIAFLESAVRTILTQSFPDWLLEIFA